ncbi:MAG: ShlB/FhaC/HecB family hemolysin secretion/activation protein, partial [Burkholderiaceae bacterium]
VGAPYLGRDIDAAELEELRQKLTRLYVERGYVNSGVLLAPQGPGEVAVFDVVEGRLTGVRVTGMDRLDEAYVVRRLVKDTDGPLNLELLRERFQLLLGDPLFARLNGRLTPGERPGEAYFDVDVVRALPYQLIASFNNYRPPSIGAEALGLKGSVRNLTGQGDLLEAHLEQPTEQSSGTGVGLAWHMPLGYHGTQLSVVLDRGRSSVIEEPTNVLDIRSTLSNREIGISQTIVEDLRYKFTLGLDHSNRENRTFLLGQPFSFNAGEPNGVVTEEVWRFWQDFAYRTETSVSAFRSTFSSGRNNLQTATVLPGGNNPPRRFNIWLGQAQYVRQVLDNGAQVIFKATAQRSADRLLALDGLAIGGVNTVRGFRENQLVRDAGVIFNFEFEYPLVRGAGGDVDATVIPFYDRGRGWNKGESAATISSWGLASRIRWQGFALDVVLAKRLSSPPAVKGPKSNLQDKGIAFQLSHAFF